MQYILLFLFVYYSNKYIDLEFYVRLLMYGHRVLNRFEGAWYFISRSWIRHPEFELSEDDLTTIYNEESIITPRSVADSPNRVNKLKKDDIQSFDSFTMCMNSQEDEEL